MIDSFKTLSDAARVNHRRGGSVFHRAELPAPFCYFSEASAALAALVAQAQAHAGLPVTGEIDGPTLAALDPSPVAEDEDLRGMPATAPAATSPPKSKRGKK